MFFKSNADIEWIGLGIVDVSLPKSDWTHAAHFAAAIWLLNSPDYDAFADMPGIIRRYNTATGVPNTQTEGYHETITIASLKAARAFSQAAPDNTPLFDIANTLLASEFGNSDWVLDYWRKDLLFSAQARIKWIAPDLKPLPF